MVGSNSFNTDPSSTPPKLSLYSLPTQRPEPPGMATPPLRVRVSVPFSWEEAPGKPRKEPAPSDPRPSPSRGLELPPRLVAEEMRSGSTSMSSSSTTVFDGPFVLGRANSCYSFSFGEERSVRAGGGAVKTKERGVWSWTRGRGRKVRGDGSWEMGFGSFRGFISPSLSSSSQSSADSMVGDGALNAREEEANKHDGEVIRITRFRRTRSLTGASSQATSQLWAGIYGRLKHAVPWRKGRGV